MSVDPSSKIYLLSSTRRLYCRICAIVSCNRPGSGHVLGGHYSLDVKSSADNRIED